MGLSGIYRIGQNFQCSPFMIEISASLNTEDTNQPFMVEIFVLLG